MGLNGMKKIAQMIKSKTGSTTKATGRPVARAGRAVANKVRFK